jgi:hypothetical protein
MRHCLLVLAAAFGMLGLVAPGSSQAAGPQVPGVLVAQYNPYHKQQQQGLLLTQLGVLLATTGAIIAIFAARARKQKQEQEEAEQRQRDAQRRRAEEGERRGNS